MVSGMAIARDIQLKVGMILTGFKNTYKIGVIGASKDLPYIKSINAARYYGSQDQGCEMICLNENDRSCHDSLDNIYNTYNLISEYTRVLPPIKNYNRLNFLGHSEE
jgi:hypothetical protein